MDPATALALIGAASSLYKGFSGKGNAKRQAKAAKREARDVEALGQREATILRRRGTEAMGSARAGYGRSGVDVNTGTASLVQQTIGERAEFDALTSILQSKLQAQALRREAKGMKKVGKQDLFSGILGAGASLLGG